MNSTARALILSVGALVVLAFACGPVAGAHHRSSATVRDPLNSGVDSFDLAESILTQAQNQFALYAPFMVGASTPSPKIDRDSGANEHHNQHNRQHPADVRNHLRGSWSNSHNKMKKSEIKKYGEEIISRIKSMGQKFDVSETMSSSSSAASLSSQTASRSSSRQESPYMKAQEVYPGQKAATSPGNLARYPVVLMPGLSGSRLNARLNRTSAVHWFCEKNSDWFNIWVNNEEFLPGVFDCFVDNMRLIFDPATGEYSSPQGVDIKVDFDYDSIIHMIPKSNDTEYLNISNALVASGYQIGVDLFGFPYDFRFGPDVYTLPTSDAQYSLLRNYIEAISAKNNGLPVIFITLSMGSPYTHLFLTRAVDTAWKDRYIRSFVSLSGPWAGSQLTTQFFVSGSSWKIPGVNSDKMAEMIRTFGSAMWMMPRDLPWQPARPIVRHGSTQYTTATIDQLLVDANKTLQVDMHQRILPFTTLAHPGVPVFCLYGYNVSTTVQFNWNATQSFEDPPAQIIYEDGDGTVESASLTICEQWKQDPLNTKYPVVSKSFVNYNHVQFLVDPISMQSILSAVLYNKMP